MSLPILSNVLLETEKGRLKISATNLEIGVVVSIGAKIEKEGKVTVPAKILWNFISNLPAGDVLVLEMKDQYLEITSTVYQIRIKGMDGKDFPIIPAYTKAYAWSFSAQALKKALGKVLFCVSVNEARLELTGVQISFSEGIFTLVATDSFRLAEEKITLKLLGKKEENSEEQSFIIPSSVFQEVLRVIQGESEEIKMAIEENQIFFEVGGVEIVSRLINGKYPDYKQIIPKNFSLQVIFNKQELQRAVKISGALSSYSSGEIALFFDQVKKTCTFLSRSQEVGENKTTLPVAYIQGNEPLTIIFNLRYVLEGINALSSEKVLFCANTGTNPAAFRLVDQEEVIDDHSLYLMMPIRK